MSSVGSAIFRKVPLGESQGSVALTVCGRTVAVSREGQRGRMPVCAYVCVRARVSGGV